MKIRLAALAIIGLALASTQAFGHHSFSATFTDQRTSTIEGVVTRFSFRNPHILIYMDVTDNGSVTEWIAEGGSATGLRRRGWSADTIEAGQILRISGDATHDGSPMVALGSIHLINPDTGAVVAEIGGSDDVYQPVVAESLPLTLDDGRPNLSSAWSSEGIRSARPGQFSSVPLNEAGLALQAEFDISTDPQVFCDPVGLVRQVITPHPIRITQLDDRVIIEYEEYAGRREIFFDDSNFVGINTHLGNSVARYEGNALVIESNHLLANQATNTGNRLTDEATVVETYTRADDASGTKLNLNIRISDPNHLSEDLVHDHPYADQGNYEFIENDCHAPLRERTAVHPAMNFFLTSEGPGDGANLGGLEGADAHCSALAAKVGQEDKNWVAYLSTTGANSVNARDRIAGAGPFYNAKGEPIALDINDLHAEASLVTGATVVTEQGQRVNGRGDTPNRHDILTGSDTSGMAVNSDSDTTCGNWTSNGDGSALVGHFDREGGGDNPTSWNSAHGSRGCSQENLQGTGGDGLFYCFATP